MKREAQLIWGIATIVGILVILLWLLRWLQGIILWLRFNFIPGVIMVTMTLGILWILYFVFFGKEDS